MPDRLVRIAELEIDPEQLTQYTAALRDEIQTSIRIEPGVISLYTVALKSAPTKIRLLEIYANDAAYQAHLATPHFKNTRTLRKAW
jgi:quinol monooxygenase YgiN